MIMTKKCKNHTKGKLVNIKELQRTLNNFRKTLRDDKDSRKSIGRCQVASKKGQGKLNNTKNPMGNIKKTSRGTRKRRFEPNKTFGKNVLNKIIVTKDTWRDAKDIPLRNFACKWYA